MAELAVAPPLPAPGPLRTRPRATKTGQALRIVTVLWVGILVLVPLGVILWRTLRPGLGDFFAALSTPEAVHAFQVTAVVAGISVVINTVFGVAAAVL
ncbi:MAG TPA: hypothetical protein VFU35_11100, partial [Jatrophihabitans sp.]|nr:hypothetical protein [Jatrophihabitans sp.]